MRIDSHQHFWNYSSEQYPWLGDSMNRLRRDFLPPDLECELAKADFEGSIAVQARQTIEESRWLLDLAGRNPLIRGVVGWVDLCSDAVEEQLGEFASHPKFAGIRHVVQDEPDDEFMLRRDFARGIGKLKQFNLTYDILVYPRQLPAAIQLAERFPEQKFVLDHLGKPLIKEGALLPWAELIRRLAVHENVWCKISGMVTEAAWEEWKKSDFRPYMDVVLDAFGPERVMFGSDWPVCLVSARYEQVFEIVAEYFARLPKESREKFFGVNASDFYGV